MLRGLAKPIDLALLMVLLVLAVVVAVLLTLPEPPASPPPTLTSTPSVTPTVTATWTPIPPRTPRVTSTPTAPPTELPTATPVLATPTPRPTAPPGSTATPLPLVALTVPLPHSGFFIRRHNDFAATDTSGVEALLADGITVGAEVVSLPPISPLTAPASGVRVPAPRSDEGALALRYGLTEIPLSERRDGAATHYLEIALRTRAEQETAVSPAVAYVFVVDTSGSMAGAKLIGARAAMRALFAEMRPQDTIGIVDFDDQVRAVLPATPAGDLTPAALNQVLAQLLAQGGTDIDLGLMEGIAEVKALSVDHNVVSHVVLFSDGNPTDRVTDWMQIRNNLVTVIGDATIRVSTFAFGADANARELDALAGVTGADYGLVADPAAGGVGQALADDLARRDRLAAKDIRLTLQIEPEVEIRHFFGHDQVGAPISRAALDQPADERPAGPAAAGGNEGMRIVVPDMAVGEAYWIVLEIALPAESPLITAGWVDLTYVDAAAAQPVATTQALALGASLAKLPVGLVLQHALGAWTSEVAFHALDDLNQDDLATAARRLTTHRSALAAAYADLTTVWVAKESATVTQLSTLADALAAGDLTRAQTADARALLTYGLEALGKTRTGVWRP